MFLPLSTFVSLKIPAMPKRQRPAGRPPSRPTGLPHGSSHVRRLMQKSYSYSKHPIRRRAGELASHTGELQPRTSLSHSAPKQDLELENHQHHQKKAPRPVRPAVQPGGCPVKVL